MIFDTNAVSAFADGDAGVLQRLQELSTTISLPVIVLGEDRYGLKASRERAARAKWLDDLEGNCPGPAAPPTALLGALGYKSQKHISLSPNTPENFLSQFDQSGRIKPEQAQIQEWQTVDFLFQLTGEEIQASAKSLS